MFCRGRNPFEAGGHLERENRGVIKDKKRRRLSCSLCDLNVLGKIGADGYFHSKKCRCVLNLDLLT